MVKIIDDNKIEYNICKNSFISLNMNKSLVKKSIFNKINKQRKGLK